MKLNKILFAAALASVIGGSMTSCSESFLDEDLKQADLIQLLLMMELRKF